MVAAMSQEGIPAAVSNSAGSFVCNHLFYGLMHFLAEPGNVTRCGFVLIQNLPEQAARIGVQPSMAVETIVKGLEISIATVLASLADIR